MASRLTVTAPDEPPSPVASPNDPKNGHKGHSETATDNGFADAIQAIMRLPLSDAEKAEAVRQLLARG